MWKKEGVRDSAPAPRMETATPRPEPPKVVEPPGQPKVSSERAIIGRSITIKGEVTGDEDLLIQGRVNGSVNLRQHAVTVGSAGDVKADISGRVVTVEGRVEGNLSATEQVILRSSAVVEGDIAAPRVVLEDGARFRGGVDMGETMVRSDRTGEPTTTAAAWVSESARTVPGADGGSSQLETSTSIKEETSGSTGNWSGASQAIRQVAR